MNATLSHPTIVPGSRLLMEDVDWATYTHFLKMFAESSTVKLTYDRGTLEIMSPSIRHDDQSRNFVLFLHVLAEEWNLPLKAAGSTTMRRRPKQAGLEADECFWLKNSPRMAGRRSLDLGRDPPPDLAVEIDLRRSKMNRMSLYARLGVPEVWRMRKKGLEFFHLDGKKYAPAAMSLAFPGLEPALIEKFLENAAEAIDVNHVLREFRVAARKCRMK
jgi:Uma2 family endonuclease